jgi:F-box protein 9
LTKSKNGQGGEGSESASKTKNSPRGKSSGGSKGKSVGSISTAPVPPVGDKEIEEAAKQHFLAGVTLERQGSLYEAVQSYRRAIQMIPDIEFRVSVSEAALTASTSPNDSDNEGEDRDFDEDGDEDDSEPLPKRILRAIEANGWQYFQKAKPDNRPHLADIPSEVITYILRWLISNDLDLRSLDVLSGVSRGFYCLCRDEQLWKMTCEKVWTSPNLVGSGFSTYREMFLTRPRVRLDGCYISKVTYVRPGEHSFQDQSYRPWHFVEYYRYIRFFPDGELYFLTTPDPPALVVSMLREKPARNSAVMKGHYRLVGNDDRVHCTAVKTQTYAASTPTRHGHGRNSKDKDLTERTEFQMYFQIQGYRNKFNTVLRWTCYAVYITRGSNNGNANGGPTLFDDFDINPTKFPPLYYSRVKSYTGRSESLLE